ncbi:Palmitoyltransferase [Mycena sanguinolenta]|uniref:Palmitoyltransferase n=1 Tax=Mycena sanguinolenta TaxID=230812 RepID=A0A8H7DIN1_9AGAR|nr:Palmitoyltransferase [Mycena sanguinolenta]
MRQVYRAKRPLLPIGVELRYVVLWILQRRFIDANVTLEVSNLGGYRFMGGRGGASLNGQMGHRRAHGHGHGAAASTDGELDLLASGTPAHTHTSSGFLMNLLGFDRFTRGRAASGSCPQLPDQSIKWTLNTEKFSGEQKAEINAACKAVFFTGRLTDFDNEILKPQVVTHLKKYKDTNGFKLFFEESSQAHTRVIFGQVGRALSGTKSFFRKSVLQSLPDEKGGGGCSVTELANTLGRKCLGGIENVKAKHIIWLVPSFLRIRSFGRLWPTLTTTATVTTTGNLPPPFSPAKRTHGGTVKGRSSNGKIIAAYWNRMQLLWKHKNKKFGTADLKSEAWTAYVNTCVAQERVRFPYDALTLITGNAAVAAPAQSSVTVNRLAALPLLNEAGGSRPPLTPRPSNAAPSFTTRSSLDQIMNTPTPFTFNGVPLPAAYSLPPLNTRRREDVGGARYNSGH